MRQSGMTQTSSLVSVYRCSRKRWPMESLDQLAECAKSAIASGRHHFTVYSCGQSGIVRPVLSAACGVEGRVSVGRPGERISSFDDVASGRGPAAGHMAAKVGERGVWHEGRQQGLGGHRRREWHGPRAGAAAAPAGARVAAVDRNRAGLDDTAEAAGAARSRLSTHVVDITDRTAVQGLPAEVVAVHGVVDGLINNAGIIQPFVPVAELDDATIQRVLDVNLMGTLHMVQAFLPHLASRPEAHLANVSSMGGFFPFPGQTMYGASKAAVRLLTEGLYAELLDTNVRVSVIFPGAVNTGISENSGIERPPTDDQGKLPILSPAKAATIMIRGIEKDKLHIYVGPDSRLMSLAIKVAPRPAIRFVQKQMSKRLPASHTPATR